jgi:membrane-associated phospholipid phosphatase
MQETLTSRNSIEVRTVDLLLIGYTLLLSILILLFHFNVEGWEKILMNNALGIGIFLLGVWGISKVRYPLLNGILRIGICLTAISYLFETTGRVVHIFFPQWMDAVIAHAEYSILGVHPTVWLQHITSPPMTEWMMFAYVIYGPMMPLIGLLAFRAGGSDSLERFLTDMALANVICFIGFLLIPVDWPGRLLGNLHTVPIKGYFFTSIADWMRTGVHFPGGCLPSPHCAVSTVMFVTAYRHRRKLAYFLIPLVLSIYLSTVYGRFHYATDVPAGILTAIFAMWLTPKTQRAFDRMKVSMKIRRTFEPVVISETLTERE